MTVVLYELEARVVTGAELVLELEASDSPASAGAQVVISDPGPVMTTAAPSSSTTKGRDEHPTCRQ